MKQHILFIDDDKDELTIFVDGLKMVPTDDGFKCTYARSTEQALEMLKYLVPDFIFVDMNTEGMTGLDFISTIKREQRFNNVRTYLYSGTLTDSNKSQALLAGATDCIAKTTSIQKLAEKLTAILVPLHVGV